MRICLLFWLLQFFLVILKPVISTVLLMDSWKQYSFLPTIPCFLPCLGLAVGTVAQGRILAGVRLVRAPWHAVVPVMELCPSCLAEDTLPSCVSIAVTQPHPVFLCFVSCALILCASQNQAKSFRPILPVFNSPFIKGSKCVSKMHIIIQACQLKNSILDCSLIELNTLLYNAFDTFS